MQGVDFNSLIQATLPKFCLSTPCNLTVGLIINALLPYIFGIAGFILLGLLVYGGYEILVSQGDPKRMGSGRDKITSAIVGFLIIFVSYWIVQLVGKILNIQKIKDIFG